ncbi:MAG: hypothetical protein KAU44_02790 [Candidatus Marinimicrobia bacterium]|nr:hypothetical protein [Candidatus Neomarinimicrobiota bacterium]
MTEDIQQYLDHIMQERNLHGLLDFEGYSPLEMRYILYDTFGEFSPLHLQKLSDRDYKNIPLLNQIKYLAALVLKNGEIKLTPHGYLPLKIVADIYSQGFIKDEFIELGISKLYRESDLMVVNLTHMLAKLAGIIKTRYGKLSMTKTGEKIITDDYKLLKLLLETFGFRFNWAYYDGYENENIGPLGFGFSMILLSKYGRTQHLDTFYAEKYLKAFPQFLHESVEPKYGTNKNNIEHCYSIRTFDRFLNYFGLIKIENNRESPFEKHITKTELYDKLIKCIPHKEDHVQ